MAFKNCDPAFGKCCNTWDLFAFRVMLICLPVFSGLAYFVLTGHRPESVLAFQIVGWKIIPGRVASWSKNQRRVKPLLVSCPRCSRHRADQIAARRTRRRVLFPSWA